MDNNKYSSITPTGSYLSKSHLEFAVNSKTGETVLYIPPNANVKVIPKAQSDGYKYMLSKRVGRGKNFTLIDVERIRPISVTLDEKHLGRLLFLQSYVDFEGKLVQGAGSTKRNMTKKELRSLLGIKQETFKEFMDCLLAYSILFDEDDGSLSLNSSYHFKGNLKKRTAIKCFSRNLQRLYRQWENNPKLLGFIYRLLPYVNYHYNCLCHNPAEVNREAIHYMNLKDIAIATGISQKTVYNRLRLLKLDDMFVFRTDYLHFKPVYFLNPFIFYRKNGEYDVAHRKYYLNFEYRGIVNDSDLFMYETELSS